MNFTDKRLLSGSRKKENLVQRTEPNGGSRGLFESRNMDKTWEKHGKIDINLLSLRFVSLSELKTV